MDDTKVWRATNLPIQPPIYKEIKISATAVDRIVAAVEETGRVHAPLDLDRGKLGKELSLCWYHHAEDRFFRATRGEAAADRRRVKDIVKTLERLLQLLDASHKPETAHITRWLTLSRKGAAMLGEHVESVEAFKHLYGWAHFFSKHGMMPVTADDTAWLAARIEDVQNLHAAAANCSLEMDRIAALSSRVSFKDILERPLPQIYLRFFKREPGGGRTNGTATSPYVRFAVAVGQEFREELDAETIIRYLQHWKKSRR